jgi:hypothetical protein
LPKLESDPTASDATNGRRIDAKRLRKRTTDRCIAVQAQTGPLHLEVFFKNFQLDAFDTRNSMNLVDHERFY